MPRVAPVITLNSVTDTKLRHLIRSPSTPQGLALRSRIVLAASAGQSNQAIAATLRIPEVTAGKWRRAFAASGIDGLQDAPRAGRPLTHGPEGLGAHPDPRVPTAGILPSLDGSDVGARPEAAVLDRP